MGMKVNNKNNKAYFFKKLLNAKENIPKNKIIYTIKMQKLWNSPNIKSLNGLFVTAEIFVIPIKCLIKLIQFIIA